MKISEDRLAALEFQAENKGVSPIAATRMKKEGRWPPDHSVTVPVTSTELRTLLDAYHKENK